MKEISRVDKLSLRGVPQSGLPIEFRLREIERELKGMTRKYRGLRWVVIPGLVLCHGVFLAHLLGSGGLTLWTGCGLGLAAVIVAAGAMAALRSFNAERLDLETARSHLTQLLRESRPSSPESGDSVPLDYAMNSAVDVRPVPGARECVRASDST